MPSLPLPTKLPLRVKLLAAFGVIVVLSLASGLLAINRMSHIQSNVKAINGKVVKSVSTIGDVSRQIEMYRKNQLARTFAPHRADRLILDGQLTTLRTQIDAKLTSYKAHLATTPRDAKDVDTIIKAWDAYTRTTGPLIVKGAPISATEAAAINAAYPYFDTIETATTDWVAVNTRIGDQQYASAVDSYHSARTTAIVALILTVLAAAALAFAISAAIQRSVRSVLDRLSRVRDESVGGLRTGIAALAEGDLTVVVASSVEPIDRISRDEVGEIAVAVNDITAATGAMIDAYNSTRASLAELIGDVAIGAGDVSRASQQMSAVTQETGRAVEEIANAVTEVANGAERQVRAIGDARRRTDDMGAASRDGADRAAATADAAERALTLAAQGGSAVDEATEAMRGMRASSDRVSETIQQLGAKSEQIGGIVDAITTISEQTNLLALNAAIEAARAGDQGRGFAVVADEVRKLAEESQRAAASISMLIGEIQDETSRAVDAVELGARQAGESTVVVERARGAFAEIGDAVREMADRVGEIRDMVGGFATSAHEVELTMSEIATVAESSSAGAEQVSASTQQTSASAQEIGATADGLAQTAVRLEQLIARFELDTAAAR
jgi:methyl-accepting chemotaxis protein